MGGITNDVSDNYVSNFVKECSNDSLESLSSSKSVDDTSSSSTLSHYSPLYELSELMAQLPIK